MNSSSFVNMAIIMGISYEKLDHKERAMKILLALFDENFKEIEK